MKTIDEAMELLSRYVKDPKSVNATADEMCDGLIRRESLCKEIGDNPVVRDFCEQYVDNVSEEIECNPYALSMFINGVLIGMEMERQELPTEAAK